MNFFKRKQHKYNYFICFNYYVKLARDHAMEGFANLQITRTRKIETWNDIENVTEFLKNNFKVDERHDWKPTTVVITNWKRLK